VLGDCEVVNSVSGLCVTCVGFDCWVIVGEDENSLSGLCVVLCWF